MNFSQALDSTLEKYGISAKWLSEQSGVSQQMISGFRNGKQRIYSDSLEKLLAALPGEVRAYFFGLLGAGNLESAVSEMSDGELADLLVLLARRLGSSSRSKSSTLVGVL